MAAVGACFGQDVRGIIARLLAEQLPDGGWNCDAAYGSTRSSFNTTICVLEALLEHERAGGGATEHAGEINLKDAMMPVVSFARLYALRHQINQTHTMERIEALAERGILLPASRDEIAAAYDFLMELRLGAQLAALQTGRPAQNVIHPGKLGHIQRELLKQAFAQIAAVQKKVSYDSLGGV